MKAPDDLPRLPAEFHFNLKSLLKAILLCAVFTVLSVWIYCYPSDVRGSNQVIGVIGALFFGALAFCFIWGGIRKKSVLTVTTKGIERPKLLFIARDDIESFG